MGDSIGSKIGADQAEELAEQVEADTTEQPDSDAEKLPGEGIHPYDG